MRRQLRSPVQPLEYSTHTRSRFLQSGLSNLEAGRGNSQVMMHRILSIHILQSRAHTKNNQDSLPIINR